MPRTAKSKSASTVTPSEVLQKFIDDYQTNPFALSKVLNVAYQSVTHILPLPNFPQTRNFNQA